MGSNIDGIQGENSEHETSSDDDDNNYNDTYDGEGNKNNDDDRDEEDIYDDNYNNISVSQENNVLCTNISGLATYSSIVAEKWLFEMTENRMVFDELD